VGCGKTDWNQQIGTLVPLRCEGPVADWVRPDGNLNVTFILDISLLVHVALNMMRIHIVST
jgi:hypothetical protein